MSNKRNFSILIIFGCILILAFSANPPQGNSGAPYDRTCDRSGCHTGGGSASGNIILEGIPTEVEPGVTYPFTITLEVSNGSAERGGFQMVVTDQVGNDVGQISSPGSSSITSSFQGRTYFEHQPAKNFNGNSVEYNASWTAPESGTATFYMSALFANGNGSRTGDSYENDNVSFTVVESNAFSASITSTLNVLCNGDENGSATVTASGGTESFTYDWDNGESGSTATSLSAGEHSVTVSDGNSDIVLEFTIVEPTPLGTEISTLSSLECSGDNNGSISALVSGGTSPYSYTWSNGASTQSISDLGPGQYNVTITDVNGCVDLANISLFAVDTSPPDLSATSSVVFSLSSNSSIDINDLEDFNINATDNCDEEIELDWSPKSFDCDDVGTNLLTITATDQSGNRTSISVQVEVIDTEDPVLTCISETLRIATCANFTYSQPIVMDNCDNSRLELISGIGINGSYPIGETRDVYLATDASGNTAMCEVVIINEPTIEVNTEIKPITCAGFADGAISVSVTGSNEPFEVVFSNGNRNDNLAAGTYEVTITDFTGCTFIREFELTAPEVLTFSDVQTTRPTNSNSGDGAIDITVTGGTAPYSYSWMVDDEFFSDDEDLILLFPGTYSVIVTDDRGCVLTSENFVLEEVTSVNDPDLVSQIILFPTPTDDYLNVKVLDVSYKVGHIQLYSADGRMAQSIKLEDQNTFDTRSLENGIYILKIKIDTDFVVRKVMIQH